MKNRWLHFICSLILLTFFCTVPVRADMGPKPSVEVTFENLPDETVYATLLGYEDGYGPNKAWDGTEEGKAFYGIDEDVWRKFVEYQDTDNFYYLQDTYDLTEDNQLLWSYFPPTVFKILLYFPESGVFSVSEILETNLFHSKYIVKMDGESIVSVYTVPFDFLGEAPAFLVRVILTVAIELSMAGRFGFSSKKQKQVILLVNIITQLLLNIWLHQFYEQMLTFGLILYFPIELIVILIEGLIYNHIFNKYDDDQSILGRAFGYSFSANMVSYLVGSCLISIWPPLG